MGKAAIYCRLSEEDHNKRAETDDSVSIQNQKTMLIQYAMEQGWEIYNIYSDDEYAGADRNRPAFNRLLKDAEAHRFDIILCKTQSRFTRELELVEKYIHGLFPVWGIRFVSIVDNADTANKGNKKSRQINGLVNEWYLEDMSENIRSVLDNRRENGLHIGAFALYGYKKDPAHKGHLLVDGEAAAVVREVFTLFAQGYGKTAIARLLNDRGIPNPTEYKRLHGLRYRQPEDRNSTLWKYYTIADMLANEIYIGNMVQGRYGSQSYKTRKNISRPPSLWYKVPDTHAPLISQTLWDVVQERLHHMSHRGSKNSPSPFAGRVFCHTCGAPLCATTTRGKRYLQCSTRHAAKAACTGAFLSEEALKNAVLQQINTLIDTYSVQIDLRSAEQTDQTNLDAQRTRMREQYRRSLRLLYLDRAAGRISESDAQTLTEQLKRDLARLRAPQTESEGPAQTKHTCRPLRTLTSYTMQLLIQRIEVGRRAPGSRTVPVCIHWRF